jgi:uncharacterized protein (TIGR02246 family)
MDTLRQFAAGYTAAWCSQNAASVAAFFAPDETLTINDGAPSCGRAAITEAAQSFMSAFPDLQVSMDNLIVEGDRAIYHWTLDGHSTGPGGTGARVHIQGREHWRMSADGFIAESRGTFDPAEYARQLEQGTGQTTRLS